MSGLPIEPRDRVVVMSGTGIISKAAIAAFLHQAIPAGMVMDTYDDLGGVHRSTCTKEPAEPKTEIEKWNARVQAKKDAKKASKGKV